MKLTLKEQMESNIDKICRLLQHIPVTKTNEKKAAELLNTLISSHKVVAKYLDLI